MNTNIEIKLEKIYDFLKDNIKENEWTFVSCYLDMVQVTGERFNWWFYPCEINENILLTIANVYGGSRQFVIFKDFAEFKSKALSYTRTNV